MKQQLESRVPSSWLEGSSVSIVDLLASLAQSNWVDFLVFSLAR